MCTPRASPYLLHPIPSAQQLGAGYSQPLTGRVLHQGQTEVTALAGAAPGSDKPGFNLTGDLCHVTSHMTVCPPYYKFSCFCYNSTCLLFSKMSQESPGHCLILQMVILGKLRHCCFLLSVISFGATIVPEQTVWSTAFPCTVCPPAAFLPPRLPTTSYHEGLCTFTRSGSFQVERDLIRLTYITPLTRV